MTRTQLHYTAAVSLPPVPSASALAVEEEEEEEAPIVHTRTVLSAEAYNSSDRVRWNASDNTDLCVYTHPTLFFFHREREREKKKKNQNKKKTYIHYNTHLRSSLRTATRTSV
jgi:hypothetical protein